MGIMKKESADRATQNPTNWKQCQIGGQSLRNDVPQVKFKRSKEKRVFECRCEQIHGIP